MDKRLSYVACGGPGQRGAVRRRGAALIATLLFGSLQACRERAAFEGSLSFRRHGEAVATRDLADLVRRVPPRVVHTNDPYYGEDKRFRALPLTELLALAFGEPPDALRKRSFLLVARDGYKVPIEGTRLLDGKAFVALDDVDVPGFAAIGPRKVSPKPAYLIWEGTERTNVETYPRPWQLASIEIVDADALYPHARPRGVADADPAMRGYRLFRERCIRCHAVNREGGSVGPDLNVPQSIVAYRPEAQVRAYIRDPRTFRYGAMPANPDLTQEDLDALLAYFRVMATQPYDPEAESKP